MGALASRIGSLRGAMAAAAGTGPGPGILRDGDDQQPSAQDTSVGASARVGLERRTAMVAGAYTRSRFSST
jgi:hypothetical protein